MQGIELVAHAIKMLFRDIWAMVKLTVLPMLIGFTLMIFISFLFSSDGLYAMLTGAKPPQHGQGAGDFLADILALFILVTTMFWAAIGWHLFVLLEEHPGRILPHFSQNLAVAYLWATIRLGLISYILLIPFMFFIMAFVGGGPQMLLIVSIASTAIYALILRFGLVLPGAAVGKPMSLRQSWTLTKGKFGLIIFVALALTVLGNLAKVNLVPEYLGWAISIFLSWFSFAFGISILTTIYGVYVEKRAL
ncbi:MAG: hypothetical protein ACI9BH_002729 [Paracoccaceae bacterium]|jgi:hypothetical protein